MDSAVLQHDLQELHDNKRTGPRLAPVAKIHYLREIRDLVMANADGWVSAGAELKGLTLDSPVVAEEWLSGPYPTVTWINDVIETLTAIDRGEDPRPASRPALRRRGRPRSGCCRTRPTTGSCSAGTNSTSGWNRA